MSEDVKSEVAKEKATEDESGAVLSSLGMGWGLYQARLLILLWVVIDVTDITIFLNYDNYKFWLILNELIFRTISGMVVGITITSPGLLFAVPKHQCVIPQNVTYSRPSNFEHQSCYLETAQNVMKFISFENNFNNFNNVFNLRSLNPFWYHVHLDGSTTALDLSILPLQMWEPYEIIWFWKCD